MSKQFALIIFNEGNRFHNEKYNEYFYVLTVTLTSWVDEVFGMSNNGFPKKLIFFTLNLS